MIKAYQGLDDQDYITWKSYYNIKNIIYDIQTAQNKLTIIINYVNMTKSGN